MLSVFMTPWMNPTSIQRATSDACASTTPLEEREVWVLRVRRVRVVTGDGVVGEARHERRVVAASRRTGTSRRGDDSPRLGRVRRPGSIRVARDLLAGRDHRQRPGGGDAERVHRLADQVLAQHRADGGLAVAAARERRAPRTLQVQVATASVSVEHLTEQERSTVAEPRREPTELVTRVRLGHGDAPSAAASPTRTATPSGVVNASTSTPSSAASSSLSASSLRRRNGRRLPRLVQAGQVTDEGVVELEQWLHRDGHRSKANSSDKCHTRVKCSVYDEAGATHS